MTKTKKVEIKNLLYHPLSVLISEGRQVSVKARSKMVFNSDVLVDSIIQDLLKKEFIKMKSV